MYDLDFRSVPKADFMLSNNTRQKHDAVARPSYTEDPVY